MRGHLQEHLLLVWAGILQQQGDNGLRQAPTPAYWRRRAEALWTACARATLVNCHIPEVDEDGEEDTAEDSYSR